MKEALVSIIVPVFNVENYIEKCLNSIINQTYKNIEVILVDDGSTDNSGNICDVYSKKYNFIKVFHTKNGGVARARNIGLKNVTGKYITFVDSDDWIKEDYIMYLYSNLIKYNSEISCCNFDYIDENEKIRIDKGEEKVLIFNTFDALENLLYQKELDTSLWGKLYHRGSSLYLYSEIFFLIPNGMN